MTNWKAIRRLTVKTVACCIFPALLVHPARAEEDSAGKSQEELKKLSLEQLLEFDVTSVSKRPEPLQEVSTAIHIITQDDIRRSGANSIPEALRLADNL